jgi:hypothetical protein
MRPTDHLLAVVLTVGPAVGVPLHGGPLHDTQLHVLADSVLGLVVGVALVAGYLAVLMRTDSPRDSDDSEPTEAPGQGRQSRNS